MDRWRDKVAVVTGAASGIGTAVAKALVHHGMVVVGIDKRDDKMKCLADDLALLGKFHTVKADLRREEDILVAFSWVEAMLGGADVLVNNAGVFRPAGIEEGTVEEWREMLDVNVLANSICAREFLRSLRKNGKEEGHIFVTNSVMGHLTSPNAPMYIASKHALRAISGCLRKRLAEQGSRIKVTDIYPGSTYTGLVDDTPMAGIFDTVSTMAPEDVASAIVSALATSPVTQICEIVLTPLGSSVKDAIY